MTITYPLDTPAGLGIRNVTWKAINAVAVSASPFTYRQQVFQHPGQRWEAAVSIPPLTRDEAEQWVAFLVSLKGQVGTFMLPDPSNQTPRGAASSTPGTPLVDGADQTGAELEIDGAPSSVSNYLRAGDVIQVNTASSSTFHKVLVDVTTDGTGSATLDIWPNINNAHPDDTTVIVSDAKGLFRLSENMTEWSVNEAQVYGITFNATQVII